MNLGENIYRLRTERNMSQGDFADAMEVSRQSVSKWENNSAVPELEKLVKMAEVFGISLDELVKGTPPALPATEPPEKVIYVEVEKSATCTTPRFSNRTIFGIILIGIGLLGLLLGLLLSSDLMALLLIIVPVLLTGFVLLYPKTGFTVFSTTILCVLAMIQFYPLFDSFLLLVLLVAGVGIGGGYLFYRHVESHDNAKDG
ncbi:MAG: helix-turn-helix transcriptional regulator [Oscillospiraceae bacterium]|nr:helix-turn-helix transcriptional regulator [Oscillospiraceae bacterium]